MKYFKIILTLLMNRAFVSACLTVAGIVLTSIYGRDFLVDEKLTETILTIAGGLFTALGFTGALTTDFGKSESK